MHLDDDRFPSPPTPPADPGAVRTSPTSPDGPAVPPRRSRGPWPVPPGVEYHRVLAGEKRRIGRGILAIVLLLAGLFVFGVVLSEAAAFIDTRSATTAPAGSGPVYTPLFHAATLSSIALLIPWSMAIQRWLYGVRAASLHSVVSRFRFDVFGRAVMFIGPVWLIASVVLSLLVPKEQAYWSSAGLAAMFVFTVLLAPLQSAGEEYGLRGLVLRVAGSWGRGPRAGLASGVLVSSLVFMVIHLSTDPWLNLWYFTSAVSLALITWRTGGIEIAIVVHALNNTFLFLFDIVMHSDFDSIFERSAGAGSPAVLVLCAAVVAITAVVWLRTRRTGPVLTPSGPQSVRG
ncbi:CPBP family intramembrane glutamic endopeptidase [Nocardiopsis ansamitocini]|uniref:CAAX prenyl protease 2/Lysostaphin resistance protein A-like domain-containing protein n=1 Tax=Nocardiopsis ansamitocini TaxID=1670832 RepID=A0A9W6UGJ7_9ACTN|nr:CPBP family intramembrane glutamic endopeptidase [Nocardiopsis ansamitocini]GLU47611.1 hypothetical protein Nans01_19620 [Nocardiopsis ansamitocini]